MGLGEFSTVLQTRGTVSNSPNPSRVYIKLCKHGKRFLLLKCNAIDWLARLLRESEYGRVCKRLEIYVNDTCIRMKPFLTSSYVSILNHLKKEDKMTVFNLQCMSSCSWQIL